MEGKCHALVWLYIPRGLYPPEGGAVLLALPVGAVPLEEGQSVFYRCPRGREQPMVVILHLNLSSYCVALVVCPYLTVLPGVLLSRETCVGSQDPRYEGYKGRAHHGGPWHPVRSSHPFEVSCVLTRCLKVCCVPLPLPLQGTLANGQIVCVWGGGW